MLISLVGTFGGMPTGAALAGGGSVFGKASIACVDPATTTTGRCVTCEGASLQAPADSNNSNG
jgi:hypothetical protein